MKFHCDFFVTTTRSDTSCPVGKDEPQLKTMFGLAEGQPWDLLGWIEGYVQPQHRTTSTYHNPVRKDCSGSYIPKNMYVLPRAPVTRYAEEVFAAWLSSLENIKT